MVYDVSDILLITQPTVSKYWRKKMLVCIYVRYILTIHISHLILKLS